MQQARGGGNPEMERSPGQAQARSEQARRLRERFAWLNRFSDQELQQISICSTGAEIKPGDTYFDISHPEAGPFVGLPGQIIPEGACLVQKADVPASIWQKLTSFP